MAVVFGKANLAATVAIAVIAVLVFPWACLAAQAQTGTSLQPTDIFSLPESNGSIRFNTTGTYAQANLQGISWNFSGLRLSNSQNPEKLQLKVSAQDSNVTITSYQKFNTTFFGARLRYVVEGQGKQSFNLGVIPRGAEWSITINGAFMGENDGWKASSDGTVTITPPTKSNVTLAYYLFLDPSIVNRSGSNQPFYIQHSVIITTAIAVASTVVLCVAIRKKTLDKRLK